MERSFIRLFRWFIVALMAQSAQAQHNIPVDKGLDPAWVRSLYDSGTPTRYLKSRNELRYIGMPVGGIMAGGVYLGGDGRLWLWDIFNESKEGVDPKVVKWEVGGEDRGLARSRDGANYIEPSENIRPLAQDFMIEIDYAGKTFRKTLEASWWDEISFEASYPVGVVRYTDRNLPLELTLHAYSPFIPLDASDSALPATIMSFSARNTGSGPMTVRITGYLENKCGIRSADGRFCRRANEAFRTETIAGVYETLEILKPNDLEIDRQPDYGTMCIAAIDPRAAVYCRLDPTTFTQQPCDGATGSLREPLIGGVGSLLKIGPGAEAAADFVISWRFPNIEIDPRVKDTGHSYAKRFASAEEVARYVGDNFGRLSSQTMLWRATWQDTTLPQWFMERTFLTINTLATANCIRFSSGRFWAWEGVGACAGTCTHVWHYAQGMGRIFPELERDCRQRTDLAIAMQSDGGIVFRAEMETRPAIDGQAGTVLRCYREHQMSPDNAFLTRNWPQIKRAVQFIIDQDRNGDGMEDTPMENTLDAVWDGEIAWIVGLCVAGVKAGGEMASEAGDEQFARLCAGYVEKGSRNMDSLLFNGEYYIHRPDPEKGRSVLGSYNTCHIDQVLGQAWAWQVGMGRIQDRDKTLSALRALWKYNFTADVGPYIMARSGGRPYALPGEGGMIMNTNPSNEPKPFGDNVTWQAGYFNECMSGFEHQVAAHMIAEGMVDEGLVLTRAVHDRYHASKRNPFNEIECSDHYARAMASYGSLIAACGYEYHGPRGYMRFAPRWDADRFRAPFTAAQGWGTYAQEQSDNAMECRLDVKYGRVELQEFSIDLPASKRAYKTSVTVGGHRVPARVKQQGQHLYITFARRTAVAAGQSLQITAAVR